jgi:hypothetical protein
MTLQNIITEDGPLSVSKIFVYLYVMSFMLGGILMFIMSFFLANKSCDKISEAKSLVAGVFSIVFMVLALCLFVMGLKGIVGK